MRYLIFSIITFSSIIASEFTVDNIKFNYYKPAKYNENSPIILLLGGRNWDSKKTLETYNFYGFANRYNAFLLSPTLVDKNYWEVENWSGKIINKAIDVLQKKYKLKKQKLSVYGYSAGAQTAISFYNWNPDNIQTVVIHACGVYPEKIASISAPILITCGIGDEQRIAISRFFIYRYREQGGELLWKIYPTGHELTAKSLALANAWFEAIFEHKNIKEFGEDETMQIKNNIDIEYRNPILTQKIKALWIAP